MNLVKNMNNQNSLDIVDIYPFKDLPIQLIFEEKIVNLAIKSASQQQNSSNSYNNNDSANEFHCLFTASPVIDEETSRLSLIIDGFDQGKSAFNCNGYKTSPSSGFNIKPSSQVPGCIYVPVRVINNGLHQINGKNNNLLESNQNQNTMMSLYANSVSLLSNYCTSNSISIDSLSNFISIFSTISYRTQANTVSADLYFDTISLSNRFLAQPANQMPILTTALSKALQSAVNFYSTPKTGYCTIYQNNKILLVLESDPKANTLPLVGIWISGIREVNHPLVWSACMRYKFSSSILKRVNDDDDSFLIVLFPSTHKKPEFYKCTTSQFNLEFSLFSGQEKLITTKNLCNNMISNKSSHIDERFITVDLLEITEGFKLKSFMNAINGNSNSTMPAMKNGYEKNQVNDPLAIDTPVKSLPEFHVPHAYEQINRSQCVSDISLLSDDGGSQHPRRYLSFDNNTEFNKQMKQQQMYENSQNEIAPVSRPGHSMLFGIPRNPPLPIGFPQNTNDFTAESKLNNYNLYGGNVQTPTNKPQETMQKRSPPTVNQQQHQQQHFTKDYNNSNKFEQMNEYLDEESEMQKQQSQNNAVQQMNYNEPVYQQQQQLKRQHSYPTFAPSEPMNKIEPPRTPFNPEYHNSNISNTIDTNLRLSGNLHADQHQQQFSSRRSSEFSQSVNELIQTPKGLMTQQDLVYLLCKQEEQLKTLQEQVNRLMATNSHNNTIMTDNSKNSDSSSNERNNFSSTEQRSMSSLKSQQLGSEMSQNELNNSQNSANKASSSGGMLRSTSVSSNMGSLGVASSSEMKMQPMIMSNNNNLFNEDNGTMYRSIEHGRDSPVMLFDQSARSNDEMQSSVECFKQPPLPAPHQYNNEPDHSIVSSSNPKTKSDESNNSWKSSSDAESTRISNSSNLKEAEKKLAFMKSNSMLDDDEEDYRQQNNYDSDNDDSDMNIFNTALKHLNERGVNVQEEILNNPKFNNNNINGNGSHSYYMHDPTFLPKLQYVSMYLDEIGDNKNLSLEVNALAMKYLKDEQLSKVAKGITQGKRASFSGLTPLRNRMGGNYLDECENDGSTICESNNFSLASKQYLEKYFPKKSLKNPAFDRSLSTPVSGTTSSNGSSSNGMNSYNNMNHQHPKNKQLYSDGDITQNDNSRTNNDEDGIWLFSNPHTNTSNNINKIRDNNNQALLKQIKSCPNNHMMMQQQQNDNQNDENKKSRQTVAYEQQQQKPNYKQKNYNDTYKMFDNEEDDTSHILDVETLKRLPKLL